MSQEEKVLELLEGCSKVNMEEEIESLKSNLIELVGLCQSTSDLRGLFKMYTDMFDFHEDAVKIFSVNPPKGTKLS